MRLMDVLTSVVIETSVGSAVRVKLTVAFEEELERRYKADADCYSHQKRAHVHVDGLPLKLRNICGITLPACGIGPSV